MKNRSALASGFSFIICVITLIVIPCVNGVVPPSRKAKEVIGVIHANSRYTTDGGATDSLNEGIGRIATLGSRAVKLWLNRNVQNAYLNFYWNDPNTSKRHPWPTPTNPQGGFNTPKEVVQLPYYQAALQNPGVGIYALETYLFTNASNPSDLNWLTGITTTQSNAAYSQVFELAKYLLQTYAGTGKTFILQNWEGDNDVKAMRTATPAQQATAIASMKTFLQQRQQAVSDARAWAATNGYTNVNVYHAFEINELPTSSSYSVSYPLLIDTVVPYVQCDLYSYSSWQSIYMNTAPQMLYQMAYMRSKVPTGGILSTNNIFIGEYGSYEQMWFPNMYLPDKNKLHHSIGDPASSDELFAQQIAQQTDYLLKINPRYMFFWSLYAGGMRADAAKPTSPAFNEGTYFSAPYNVTEEYFAGTWLIRPPGYPGGVTNFQGPVATPGTSSTYTFTKVYNDLRALLPQFIYFDNINDLSFIHARTSSTAVASGIHSWSEGDGGRVYRTTSLSNQNVVYFVAQNPGSPSPTESITDWNIKAFLMSNSTSPTAAGKLRGYVSPDGVNWSPAFNFVESDLAQPDPATPTWYRIYLQPPASLPAGFTTGQKYLKIEWYGTPVLASYETQIGSVQIFTKP